MILRRRRSSNPSVTLVAMVDDPANVGGKLLVGPFNDEDQVREWVAWETIHSGGVMAATSVGVLSPEAYRNYLIEGPPA